MELWEYNLLSAIKRRWIFAALVFILLTAGFGYAYHTTPKTITYRSMSSKVLYHWSGGISGSGVVTRPNPIWTVGEKVELPIYPISIMPLAEVKLAFNVSGNDVNLKFERELKVIYYISYDKERIIEKVYRSSSNVSAGSFFSERLLLNVSDIFDTVEATRSVLKLPQEQTGVEILGKVKYSGTVDGKPVQGTQEFKGSLSFPYEGFYTISDENKNGTQTFTTSITKTLPTNERKRALFLLMSILSGALAVFAVAVGRKFDPSKYDPEKLILEKEKKKLAKWISTGKFPENSAGEKIELASLSDLVEAAIDMNKRVIHDPEKGLYFFINEGVLYYFGEKNAKKEN